MRIVLIFKLIQYAITLPNCIFVFFKEIYLHRLKKKLKSTPSAQRCPRHPSVLTYAWSYPYQLPAEITVPRCKDVHQHMVTNKVPDLVLGSSAGTDHLCVWTISRKENLSIIAASCSLSTALNVLAQCPSPLPPSLPWKPLAFKLSLQVAFARSWAGVAL